jgi:hypothetical protein
VYLLNGSKGTPPVVIRHAHRILHQGNEIGRSVSRQIDDESPFEADWVVAEHKFGGLEGPISIPNRHENTVLAKPYYISTAISINVSDDSRMVINAPALFCTEVLDNKSRCLECSISVA